MSKGKTEGSISLKLQRPFEEIYNDSPGWSNDCSVKFARSETFPLVTLISPPGAGNTWTRHLNEQATGFYTGSVYNNKKMYMGGLLGEYENFMNGNTLTVKVHSARRLARVCKAAILILRNPIDVAIAERNRRLTHGHVHQATWNKDSHMSKDWHRFVNLTFVDYERIVTDFLRLQVPTLVVHYENMKDDTLREVKRIVKFLNMTMNEKRELCVVFTDKRVT